MLRISIAQFEKEKATDLLSYIFSVKLAMPVEWRLLTIQNEILFFSNSRKLIRAGEREGERSHECLGFQIFHALVFNFFP